MTNPSNRSLPSAADSATPNAAGDSEKTSLQSARLESMQVAAIGFDVGGTNARIWVEPADRASAGLSARCVWRRDSEAPTVERLGEALATLWRSFGGQALPDCGIGIGFAGQLSADGRIVRNAPNLGWRDVRLASQLETFLGRPSNSITLLNDVNAILEGELFRGVARGRSNAIAIFAGTGVGGAFSVGGRVVAGATGNAGEIGHVKLAGFDGACGCGEFGCLEARAGGAALLRRLASDVASGLAPGFSEQPTVADVDREFGRRHPYAVKLWDEISSDLALVASGLATFLNPEMFVLGGGVFANAPRLRDEFARKTLVQTLAVCRDVEIVNGTLGDDAGAIGAASVAHRLASMTSR